MRNGNIYNLLSTHLKKHRFRPDKVGAFFYLVSSYRVFHEENFDSAVYSIGQILPIPYFAHVSCNVSLHPYLFAIHIGSLEKAWIVQRGLAVHQADSKL